jgi:hypothetical protein
MNGYFMKKISCLLKHKTRDITFSLIVDDFGLKYTKKEDVKHLFSVLKYRYKTHVDWSGTRFLGITLDWEYDAPIRKVTTSMPNLSSKLSSATDIFSPNLRLTPPAVGYNRNMVQSNNS